MFFLLLPNLPKSTTECELCTITITSIGLVPPPSSDVRSPAYLVDGGGGVPWCPVGGCVVGHNPVGLCASVVVVLAMCAASRSLAVVVGRSVVVGRWSVVGGRRSLVGGRWSSVVGRWSVVVGGWSVMWQFAPMRLLEYVAGRQKAKRR